MKLLVAEIEWCTKNTLGNSAFHIWTETKQGS